MRRKKRRSLVSILAVVRVDVVDTGVVRVWVWVG